MAKWGAISEEGLDAHSADFNKIKKSFYEMGLDEWIKKEKEIQKLIRQETKFM